MSLFLFVVGVFFSRESFHFAVRLSFCRESSFCREVIPFAVSLSFAARLFLLPQGYFFCREVISFAARLYLLPQQL